MTISRRASVVVAALMAAAMSASFALGQERKHASGQTVTPSFDGWFPNTDGTFSLVFGYYNRNFEEEVDAPIGTGNHVDPGPADQGQPTHFLSRRQFGAFAVTVPKDFGTKSVTWTIVTHGQALTVPGYLRPEWQINALEEITTNDKPPLVKFDAAGKAGAGPAGLVTSMKARVGQPLPIAVWATPRGGDSATESGARAAASLTWSLFRGPAKPTFSDARPKSDKASGKATTTVSFSQPGDYTLRLLAGTADTTGCCWTNAYVKVAVAR